MRTRQYRLEIYIYYIIVSIVHMDGLREGGGGGRGAAATPARREPALRSRLAIKPVIALVTSGSAGPVFSCVAPTAALLPALHIAGLIEGFQRFQRCHMDRRRPVIHIRQSAHKPAHTPYGVASVWLTPASDPYASICTHSSVHLTARSVPGQRATKGRAYDTGCRRCRLPPCMRMAVLRSR